MHITPAKQHNTGHRSGGGLLLFVLVSLAIHLILLFAFNKQSSLTNIGDHSNGSIAVTLTQRATAKTETPTTTPQQTAATAAAEKTATVAEQPAVTPQTPPATTQQTPSANSAVAQAHILATLKTNLAQHFHYPRMAIRKGWEGEVQLTFRIEADGRIHRITLKTSSGHALLDNSAKTALRKVGYLQNAKQWLNGQSLDMEIPIIYQLNKG